MLFPVDTTRGRIYKASKQKGVKSLFQRAAAASSSSAIAQKREILRAIFQGGFDVLLNSGESSARGTGVARGSRLAEGFDILRRAGVVRSRFIQ